MGLDTVELVYSIEKHFGLRIPDADCAQIGTVGEMAQWLGVQLGTLAERKSATRVAVRQKLQELLRPLPTAEDTPLLSLLPDKHTLKAYATHFASRYRLQLPALVFASAAPIGWRLLELFGVAQAPPGLTPLLQRSTFADLVNWTVVSNYKQLLKPPFDNQFDVEQAVIGLTSYSSGVEVQDIRLKSSFTNDLGMD
jgi:acyl carrier protein